MSEIAATVWQNLPDSVHIPAWLTQAAGALVRQADGLFHDDHIESVAAGTPIVTRGPGGPRKRGGDRKRWVKNTLRELAKVHDLAGVPDWLETPLENLVIDIVVEAAFAFTRNELREAVFTLDMADADIDDADIGRFVDLFRRAARPRR